MQDGLHLAHKSLHGYFTAEGTLLLFVCLFGVAQLLLVFFRRKMHSKFHLIRELRLRRCLSFPHSLFAEGALSVQLRTGDQGRIRGQLTDGRDRLFAEGSERIVWQALRVMVISGLGGNFHNALGDCCIHLTL